VGKTRLAIRVGEDVAGDFSDGVWFVALAAVRDPSAVLGTVARVLGVREAGGRTPEEGIQDLLSGRRALVVLDNAEHLLGAAPSLANLLAACPSLAVLVTSRSVLRLSGEHAVVVPPLGLPAASAEPGESTMTEAVRLFADRAAAAWTGFMLTDADAPAVAAICARLDGLPLAIELAAARVRHLTPAALLAGLDQRLPLLTGGPRDAPARLQTMRNAIDWSHDLLSTVERALFRRLAVFVGGFDLATAEAVAGGREIDPPSTSPLSALDGIASLVDKSLLRRMDGPGYGPRFAMLETVREYALERLAASGEGEATRARHAAWCLDVAERGFAALVLGRSLEPDWLDRFEAEHGNLRAALDWLDRSKDDARFARLAGVLGPFWFFRGHLAEGRRWLERALPRAAVSAPRDRAMVMNSLGVLLQVLGEPARAADLVQTAMSHWEAAGEEALASQAAMIHGWMALKEGDYARAATELAASGARFRPLAADWWMAKARYHEGEAALGLGEAARARAYFADALGRFRELDDPWGIASALQGLGAASCDGGDHAGAASLYLEALARLRSSGATEGLATWLASVATLAGTAGRPVAAARLFGAAAALCQAFGATFGLPERERFARAEASARASCGATAFSDAETAGRAMAAEQAVAEASAVLEAVAAVLPSRWQSDADAGLGLTRREEEVLRLVAAGATDREIAEALAISPRTVGVHVGHVLAKLGVETRRAARAKALRERLVDPPDYVPP
jgi:non-specific serine/threonine protein kinase